MSDSKRERSAYDQILARRVEFLAAERRLGSILQRFYEGGGSSEEECREALRVQRDAYGEYVREIERRLHADCGVH